METLWKRTDPSDSPIRILVIGKFTTHVALFFFIDSRHIFSVGSIDNTRFTSHSHLHTCVFTLIDLAKDIVHVALFRCHCNFPVKNKHSENDMLIFSSSVL